MSVVGQCGRWVASIFIRWNLNGDISNTAIASEPPECARVSPCEGSSTTGVIHTSGCRFQWCPFLSASYCSLKRVCTPHRTYTFHRLVNTCVYNTTVPCRQDTTGNYSLLCSPNSPVCHLLLGDTHTLSIGGRNGDGC